MAAPQLRFKVADNPGQAIAIEVDAQTAVTPGDRPGTAVITTPDGQTILVAGDYREVHVQIQEAAARAHETGVIEQANTPVS